jgi:hypothetical protein
VGYSEDALYWLVLGRRGRQPAGAQSGNVRVIFVIRVRVSCDIQSDRNGISMIFYLQIVPVSNSNQTGYRCKYFFWFTGNPIAHCRLQPSRSTTLSSSVAGGQ